MRLRSLQRTWNRLARADPLWAVLAASEKRGNRWDRAEFFATGAQAVEGILAHLSSLGVELQHRKALDFGCGVGRLTQALAPHFDEVWGVDIAPAMVELAGACNQHGTRCRYLLNESDNLSLFPDRTFDFVLSLITLQHMPPTIAHRYLREFVRVLTPGGVLVFQAPAERALGGSGLVERLRRAIRRLMPRPLLRLYRRVRYGDPMDMYGIPREQIERLLKESGAAVLDVAEEASAGDAWVSFRYCARRP